MERVEFASLLGVGLLLPISGIIFAALRRQTRPEVLQRILLVVLAVSFPLQIVNYWLDYALLRHSTVAATLFVMITVGATAGVGFALWLRHPSWILRSGRVDRERD